MNKTKNTNYDLNCHKDDGYLTFNEPPKTGWDLYITPEFILNNRKPVNWFHRKMQELVLGFKWKNNEIVKKVVETPYMRTTFTPSKK